MKSIKYAVLAVVLTVATSIVPSASFASDPQELGAPSHGGGCRKNSPPGQCCHMDNKTGVVHCH